MEVRLSVQHDLTIDSDNNTTPKWRLLRRIK